MSTTANIRDARKLCKERGATGVIVIVFDEEIGMVSGASYGNTKARCDAMGAMLDQIFRSFKGSDEKHDSPR